MSNKTPASEKEEEAKLLLRNLSRGASLALQNAEDLCREAALLYSHGALCRALFLHQISLEECGKIELLGGWATSLLMGHEVDVKKQLSAFASHKAKNYSNAYMLAPTKEELEGRSDGDWKRSINAFNQQQAKFHQDSNSAKNASLYVDYGTGEFSAPKEKITEEMVAHISRLNLEFLATVQPKVHMLSCWQSNLEEARQRLSWFEARAEELLSRSDANPGETMSTLMREMRERGNQF